MLGPWSNSAAGGDCFGQVGLNKRPVSQLKTAMAEAVAVTKAAPEGVKGVSRTTSPTARA